MSKDKTISEKKRRKKQLEKALSEEALIINETKTNASKKQSKPKTTQQKIISKTKEKPAFAAGTFGVILILLIFGYTQATKPRLGSIGYALCNNFLELYVTYPQYLRLASAKDFNDDKGNIVSRIWYSQLDAFGQNRMERIQCHFRITPDQKIYIDFATIDRREINRDLIEKFNASIDSIREMDLKKELPRDFPFNILDLKVDENFGRKSLF